MMPKLALGLQLESLLHRVSEVLHEWVESFEEDWTGEHLKSIKGTF